MSIKRTLKNTVDVVEVYLAKVIGSLVRLFPRSSRALYRSLVAGNRTFGDRTTLWLNPFMTTLGTTLFDLRGEAIETFIVQGGGVMQLDISEKTQRQLFSHKLFEAGVSRFVLATLRPDDVFVDVGANVGYFTMLAAPVVGKGGKVIALEPEHKNFEALARHVRENGYDQVALYNCAAGEEAGVFTLNINPLNHGGNSLLPFTSYASGQERHSVEEMQSRYSTEELFEEVSVRPLDDIFAEQEVSEIAIVKIDVEGFEKAVLMGMRESLEKRKIHYVICEVNNDAVRNYIFDLFAQNGYVAHHISFAGIPAVLPYNTILSTLHGNILFSLATRDDRTAR